MPGLQASLVCRLPRGFGLFSLAKVVMHAPEQQRQPSGGDQQLAVLSQGQPPAQQPGDITQTLLAARFQLTSRGGRVGAAEQVGGLLECVERSLAEVSSWVGSLVARGLAPSTATRALATLRSILAFTVADERIPHNVAAAVRNPTSGRARRDGLALTLAEVYSLTEACKGRYRDGVPVMALAGLRWGELAGLQVGDRISVPGPGLRLRRAVLPSEGGGALYVDTLKNKRARTVPLVEDLVPVVDR